MQRPKRMSPREVDATRVGEGEEAPAQAAAAEAAHALNYVGMIRVLVVDPTMDSRSMAERSLRMDPRLVVAGPCADGASAIALAREGGVDVAVIDMRGLSVNGLDLTRILARTTPPPGIVFVADSPEFALEAFKLGVSDYVVAPYEPGRLREAVLRAASRRGLAAATTRPMQRVIVRGRQGAQIVRYEDIELVEAAEKEVWLQVGGRRMRYASTVASMEGVLPCPPFVRVHRAFIVNLDHVRRLDDGPNGAAALTVTSGAVAAVSRGYRRRLVALFGARSR